MPKPTRVRYNGVAPFIEDTQANRVQAFGSSSRLTTEDMKELGTLNIVEIVDDVPQVDISIDQNENGTNDLVALFANKGYGCNVVALPAGSAIGSSSVKVLPGSYLVNGERVLFEGTTLAVSAGAGQKVYLLGEVSGGAVAKVAVTGGTVPAGALHIATVSGSSTIKQSDITDVRSFADITHLDYELANVDIFVPVKQSGDGESIKRTMYLEKAFVNNIDFSFQTSGVATTSYRLETDNKRWFLNTNATIVVDQFKATAAQTAFTLSGTPASLANGNKILRASKTGTVLKEGVDFTVAGTTLTLTSGATAGDLLKFRYTSSTGGNFMTPVPATENPHPELAGGIKQGQVEIYLSDDANNRVTRVQSARVSLPLTREQLAELGSIKPYDRPMQLPVNVSVSLELRDSDLELLARFAGYSNLSSANEIALEDLVKNMGLVIKIYRESDVKREKLAAGHPDKYAIKTYTVERLIPQSENWDVRVDSDATQSFEFMAHNLKISDKIV